MGVTLTSHNGESGRRGSIVPVQGFGQEEEVVEGQGQGQGAERRHLRQAHLRPHHEGGPHVQDDLAVGPHRAHEDQRLNLRDAAKKAVVVKSKGLLTIQHYVRKEVRMRRKRVYCCKCKKTVSTALELESEHQVKEVQAQSSNLAGPHEIKLPQERVCAACSHDVHLCQLCFEEGC